MASLEESSHQSIIENLGDIATGRFTCGGTLSTPSQVQLNYLNRMGVWNAATFPDLGSADFQQILESSVVASFGKGKERITDKSYRDAYAFNPDKFLTSFQVSDDVILGEIRLLLVPDILHIRAELYKMNIYTAPTGGFKAHVDTPHGGNMFGSLVVCLPSQFDGGALVVRHNGEQIVYDWSSPTDSPVQRIQWAAFYSDVEHEILPVVGGYRVTLTYNLYYCDQLNLVPTVDVTTSTFYKNLKKALNHPYFVRDGGILGFSCHHAYIFEEYTITWKEVFDVMDNVPIEKSVLLNVLQKIGEYPDAVFKGHHCELYEKLSVLTDNIDKLETYEVIEILKKGMKKASLLRLSSSSSKQGILKGSDRIVYLTAKSLGLKVEIRPILKHHDGDNCFIGNNFEFIPYARHSEWDEDGWSNCLRSQGNTDGSHITWCQKLSRSYWQPAIAAQVFGNDPCVEVCYQAAAILVSIPTWSERCGVVSSTHMSSEYKN